MRFSKKEFREQGRKKRSRVFEKRKGVLGKNQGVFLENQHQKIDVIILFLSWW